MHTLFADTIFRIDSVFDWTLIVAWASFNKHLEATDPPCAPRERTKSFRAFFCFDDILVKHTHELKQSVYTPSVVDT